MNIKREFIKKAIEELGFQEFTEIQTKVIPKALKGNDIIGCSQTGSGKTHSFLIPIFENLNLDLHDVQVVITAPTRELADQIYKNARQLAAHSETRIDIRKYSGGSNRDKEIERLKKSQPMIVIGTPGKIKDLAVKENVLNIYKASVFVIDEADMSLDVGFLDDIDKIASLMSKDLHMMVFSATIPEKIRPFLRKYMTSPEEVYIKPQELSSLNIEHIFIPMKSKDRDTILLDLLRTINPYIGLIFCNKKEVVEQVASLLTNKGFKIAKIHGDVSPRERKRVMERINKAEYQYVVASDIASRGIDIDGVSHVINYELPKDMEFYVHRSGRTGRASYEGMAISLYTVNDGKYLDFLESKGINIVYKEVKNNVLVVKRERKERDKRDLIHGGFNKHTVNVHKKNKKVKPGYKKKYHQDLQKAKRKSLHQSKKR